jgi:electron transfer flavoprotein beta subunit
LEVAGTAVSAERETDNGYQKISAELPLLVSVTKSINTPRYPALKGIMGAKKKPIAIWPVADLGLDHPVGAAGAKTEVTDVALAAGRSKGRSVTVADGAEGARVIVEFLKEKKLL